MTTNNLNNAISGTSNNVSTLGSSHAAPDSEDLRVKMNELIPALRRN